MPLIKKLGMLAAGGIAYKEWKDYKKSKQSGQNAAQQQYRDPQQQNLDAQQYRGAQQNFDAQQSRSLQQYGSQQYGNAQEHPYGNTQGQQYSSAPGESYGGAGEQYCGYRQEYGTTGGSSYQNQNEPAVPPYTPAKEEKKEEKN